MKCVIFLIIGHSSSPNNVTILRSLPTVLLPLGVRRAMGLAPRDSRFDLGIFIQCVPSNASHNLRCECIKRAHFGKYMSFNFAFGSGPFLATGLPPIFSFHVLMSIPTIDWNPLFSTIACIEFRRLKRLHPIYLVSMKTCRLCACFCSINSYHSLCGSLIVYFYLC